MWPDISAYGVDIKAGAEPAYGSDSDRLGCERKGAVSEARPGSGRGARRMIGAEARAEAVDGNKQSWPAEG